MFSCRFTIQIVTDDMKLMGVIVLFIVLAVINDCAKADTKSSHLTHFEVHQSSGQSHFSADGGLAYVSASKDLLAAAHVRLQLSSNGSPAQTYDCDSFSYNMKSQFLLCDNRDVKKTSVTVDSDFTVKRYEAANQ